MMETFLRLLSPYAPHLAEELWEKMGNPPPIANAVWPDFDENLTIESEVTIVVQINGKVRSRFQTANNTENDDLEKRALVAPRIAEYLEGKQIVKIICVPNKVVNIVVR